ncbi:cyclic nucleotide-binding domain-containing protein [Desulfonema magnum]|uniref:Cyclic nucleotide-binding domain-containing protein n=1 Tax=Desulfonema magnum TaxID=45655 RepID=A0A975BHR6_9BACT|nr:cyclic nucleotide-binding domain-containing protein [Desulfonema magnum]QTA85523.1 Cyclic nucleotide-binding domain-containing protein [Desulfonema magnum]
MIESEYLKDNVQNIQKIMAIPPLRRFETKILKQLLKLSKIREYGHGELIINEGDTDPWIYFLLSGKVRVEKEGIEIGILDNKGEIFGEMRILDGLTRSASVYAEGKTDCLAVDTSAATNRLTSDERAGILLLLYSIFTEYIAIRLCLVNDELIQAKEEVRKLKEKNK